MPGKPGARKGDSVTCPRCGETTISTGSSNVLFDGLPAASQGDCTGCGSELNSRVIANVLINGRPAVVVDSESDHDGVVIGGSGTVLIGGEFTSASLNQQPITVGRARSANPLPPTLPGRFIPWEERNSDLVEADIEEEEEEEHEQEDETAVGVTLRIGVFFDGTGNNASNTAIGALCGAQHPIKPEDVDASCKPYMRDPESSYGNDATNIQKLSELYHAPRKVESTALRKEAFRVLYIDGIGTEAGQPDSLIGSGIGRGESGVARRVQHAFREIQLTINAFQLDNPDQKITHLIFDTFGFSRGAAAARHFANEVALGSRGPLQSVVLGASKSFSHAFIGKYQHDIKMGFIGLFDTVASVGGLSNLGNVRSSVTPGLKLYLPRKLFPNVVHLVARDEIRSYFALNRVIPEHPELSLPGVHSDIGGGYFAVAEERVLVSPMQALDVSLGAQVETTSIYRDAYWARVKWLDRGWPPEMLEIVTPKPKLLEVDMHDRSAPRQKRVYAGLQLKRQVRGELSRVYLRVMYELAKDKGVRFSEIPDRPEFKIPAELQPLCERFSAGDYRATAAEKRLLMLKYIHTSAHWNPPIAIQGQESRTGILAYFNAPTADAVRVQHPHVPDKELF